MNFFIFLISLLALAGCSNSKPADNKKAQSPKQEAPTTPAADQPAGTNETNNGDAVSSVPLDMCAQDSCTDTSDALYICNVTALGKNYFTQAPSKRCEAEATLKQHLCQLGAQYKILTAADAATFKCNETKLPDTVTAGAYLKCADVSTRICTAEFSASKCTVSYQGKTFNSQGSNLCAAQRALDQTLCNDGLGKYITAAAYNTMQCGAQ